MMNWQKNLCNEIMSGDITKGELMVMTAGRQTGKSQLMKLWQQIYFQEMPKLTLREGTVYGEEYYAVDCLGYIWDDLHDWCVESFGPTSKEGVWKPHCRWYENNGAFWFREQKDRDWFVMRWS